MFCKNCGSTLNESSMFCKNCGQPTNSNNAPIQDTNFPFNPNVPVNQRPLSNQKNNTNKNIIPIIAIAAVIFIAVGIGAYILISKFFLTSDSKSDRDKIIQNGYVTEESNSQSAFVTLTNTYIQAIYEEDYEVFKACLFPGDFSLDRDGSSKLSDEEYMANKAPVSPKCDTFNSWTISNEVIKLTTDSKKVKDLQADYTFDDDWSFEKYCNITFDLTLKSDDRTITIPCNFELVYSEEHWYIWCPFFDTKNYDEFTYEYNGKGKDKFFEIHDIDN